MVRSTHSIGLIRALTGFTLLALLSMLAVAFAASPTVNEGLATNFGGFGAGGTVVDAPLQIRALALQPDGKIVAAGMREQTFALARYTSAGDLDPSFGATGVVTTPLLPGQQRAEASEVVLQPDGKIVIAGAVTGSQSSDFALLRYSAAGVLDPSFDGDGRAVVDFDGGDDQVTALALDEQGRIVVGGAAQVQLGSRYDFVALRLASDGTLDASFSDDGKARVAFAGASFATDLLILPRGGLLLVGSALLELKAVEPPPVFALARLDTQGRLDTTFGRDGMRFSPTTQGSTASSAALAPDDKLVVAGNGAEGSLVLARYTLDGDLDDTFDDDGVITTPFDSRATATYDVVTLPNSRIVVAGESGGQWAFTSFFPDGTLNNTFDGDGKLLVDLGLPRNAGARSLVRAPDGRLLAAGGTVLLRMFADGTPDAGGRQLTAFGPGTISLSNATLAQPDGKIVSVGLAEASSTAAGSNTDLALVRHLPNGTLDPSFGRAGTSTLGRENRDEAAVDALLQPDGKILTVGWAIDATDRPKETTDLLLARFNADGSPDSGCGDKGIQTLDIGGNIDDRGQAVAIQADGKLLVAGEIRPPDGIFTFVLRLEANCASPDRSFGTGGLVIIKASSEISELLVLPEGQIQLVGVAGTGGVFLARLTHDGSFDDRFGTGGKVTTPIERSRMGAAALLPDGKLLVGAARSTNTAGFETLLLRYTSSGALDPSFGEQGMLAVDLGPSGIPTALALRDDGAFALVGCYDNSLSPPIALFKTNGTLDPTFGTLGKAELSFGERTCMQDVVFNGQRLMVGGFAEHGEAVSFALAAYATNEPRALSFAPAQAIRSETFTTTTLTVRLNQTALQTVTVQYAATGGSATNGQDFILAPGTLTFAPGQSVQHIAVALADDNTNELDETITIALSSPSNAILGTNASFTLTITDDDSTGQYRAYLPLIRR